MTRKFTSGLLGAAGAIAIGLAPLLLPVSARAADLTEVFDRRYDSCLEGITKDAEAGYEAALAWQTDGGGRRAVHCTAMALFALGRPKQAAFKLDTLAKAADGGTPEMRANTYAEAAEFWLLADRPIEAKASTALGLGIAPTHAELRIARARAYALQGQYEYAQAELTEVINTHPKRADALRYRADAKLKRGHLSAAKRDIEQALDLNYTSVETALLRGDINEAIRKAETAPKIIPTPVSE